MTDESNDLPEINLDQVQEEVQKAANDIGEAVKAQAQDPNTLIAVVEGIAGFVVGSGTAKITKAIIENNVDPTNLSRYGKASVIAAAAVIGMMAKDATKNYTRTKIDETATAIQNAHETVQKVMRNVTVDIPEQN